LFESVGVGIYISGLGATVLPDGFFHLLQLDEAYIVDQSRSRVLWSDDVCHTLGGVFRRECALVFVVSPGSPACGSGSDLVGRIVALSKLLCGHVLPEDAKTFVPDLSYVVKLGSSRVRGFRTRST
jgi:hypothetical protein